MKSIRSMIKAFKRMPDGVKTICGFLAILTICLPLSLLPNVHFIVEGDQESFQHFWNLGGRFLFAAVGAVSMITSYGLITARSWSRPLTVTLALSIAIAGWLFPSSNVAAIFGTVVFGALPIWYFYCRTGVRAYFNFEQSKTKA